MRHAVAALALLFTLPACVTSAAYDKLAKPETVEVRARGSANAVVRVDGASVALVESRLTVFVSAATVGGKTAFYAASLQGLDEAEAPRAFAPVELASLPPSIMPVRFTAPCEDGFAGHPASWWHEVARDDLEHAALIAVSHTGDAWKFRVSVPDASGRRVLDTREGLVPEIDDQDSIVLWSTPAWVVHSETNLRALGCLTFIGILPVTATLDAAVGATSIAVVGAVILPFLPFLWLCSPHGC